MAEANLTRRHLSDEERALLTVVPEPHRLDADRRYLRRTELPWRLEPPASGAEIPELLACIGQAARHVLRANNLLNDALDENEEMRKRLTNLDARMRKWERQSKLPDR